MNSDISVQYNNILENSTKKAREYSVLRLLPSSVNNYIPNPDDQLDVELAKIINHCHKRIKVSMIESGKYMFGEIEPKIFNCRMLRSRMIMVRVGGGWKELSNLKQRYIPKSRSFVGSDETESGTVVGQSEGPSALKRISYARKVSRNTNE
ncbi:21529_t:CDS:2 [Gigaspora margarita]|uniref:21529_t:CDS:1 n=1 Tax=Gigaspora margarita TaxID=4874 RepID=A0ABN7VKQ4_GIGMA|nr:21529_t:CDS:2 [Gigaspora margarita]